MGRHGGGGGGVSQGGAVPHLPLGRAGLSLTRQVVHLEAEVKGVLQVLQVPEGAFGLLGAEGG